jgi:hypothetical protein
MMLPQIPSPANTTVPAPIEPASDVPAFALPGPKQKPTSPAESPRWYDPSWAESQTNQIAEWLRLLVRPGEVAELRALNVSTLDYRRPHTRSGFFDHDHLDDLAREAFGLTFDARGVYLTLNPLKPDVLARRFNRVEVVADDTGRDVDVDRRRRLLVDADPVRIAGVSATDGEKDKAGETILQVRAFLQNQGWPDPILADSGNGFHLLYDLDLPVDDCSTTSTCQ